MVDFKNSVSVITGASGGLGSSLYELLSERGSFPIGAARSVDVLAELKDSFGGEFMEYDATNPDSSSQLLNLAYEHVNRLGASHLYVIYAAGVHEDAFDENDDYTTPSSIREAKGEGFIDFMFEVNSFDPVRLLRGLSSSPVDSTFLYVSSQASGASFWDKGNSLYGPQKFGVETALGVIPDSDSRRVLATRYPFFDTPMGHKMYDQLVAGGEDLPPKDKAIVSVDDVSYATVELLDSGSSSRFSSVRDRIFSFE